MQHTRTTVGSHARPLAEEGKNKFINGGKTRQLGFKGEQASHGHFWLPFVSAHAGASTGRQHRAPARGASTGRQHGAPARGGHRDEHGLSTCTSRPPANLFCL